MHAGLMTDEFVKDYSDSKRVVVSFVYNGTNVMESERFTMYTDSIDYDLEYGERVETTCENRATWQRNRTVTDLLELGYTRTKG